MLLPFRTTFNFFTKTKGLIKVDNHYVPWNYRNHSDTAGPTEEDENADLPTISWDKEYGKYKVDFMGADHGGYDVRPFVWYFDTIDDILAEMGLVKEEKDDGNGDRSS
jgi:hypothetical protein